MNIRVIIDFLYQVSFDIFRRPVADDLLIRSTLRRIIRVTKAEGIITAKSVVKGSAQHPGFIVIVWTAPLLPNDSGKLILYRGISLDGIAVDSAWIIAVFFTQRINHCFFFGLGLLHINSIRDKFTQQPRKLQ